MQCRILFSDRSLDQFHWCHFDEVSGQVSDCGLAEVDELKTVCSDADKVIVFPPQQDLLLTSVNLPPRANKQQLNAIAFAVEEQLAEDVENCFVANLQQQPDHSVPVAVIRRELMDDLMGVLAARQVSTRWILPAIYLCPWNDDGELLASVCPVDQGYLVRYGPHAGLYCSRPVLPAALELLSRRSDNGQQRIDVYADEQVVEEPPQQVAIRHFGKIDLLAQTVSNQDTINLKQKQYQSTHAWLESIKRWKWPAVAAAVLVAIILGNGLIGIWSKQQQVQELLQQQQALLLQHLPGIEPSAQPKKQLIQVLAEAQGASGRDGFMDMLHEYTTLAADFNKIKPDRIQYQKSQLVVDLESTDLRSMETLRDKLAKSRYPAEIENVNISPDKTSGRLVMRVE